MSKTAPTPSGDGLAAPKALSAIFDHAFAPYTHIVLAVSGGADSVALLHLAASWCAARSELTPTLSVVTVDHALRPESAGEAARVAAAAARLGLPHTTLTWDGPKPPTGIQAAARDARYALIRTHLADNSWPAVATAHTADDQAETVLMRLARGSGIDGLAAMRPRTDLGTNLTLLRPLLGTTKTELIAYLTGQNITWAEDPSNHSQTFERVRWRDTRATLAAHGLDVDSKSLARSAMRAARASDALTEITTRTWATRGTHADLTPFGYATLALPWLSAQPEDIRLRLLAGLIDAIGGQEGSVSLGQLEAFTAHQRWHRLVGTLHGTTISMTGTVCTIAREWRRAPLPELMLAPGASEIWDRRFVLSLAATCRKPLRIACLGEAGKTALVARDFPMPRLPRAVLQTQPAVWHTDTLVAAPTLGYVATEWRETIPLVRCAFGRETAIMRDGGASPQCIK